MISRSETKLKLSKHLVAGGSYENVRKNNVCSPTRASLGILTRKQLLCQGRPRRPWVACRHRCMARTGMGAGLVGTVLLSPLLSLLCGTADSHPAAARGIRSARTSARAAGLLVLLSGIAGLLPVCQRVSQRMVEGCATSTQSTFFTAKIKE